MQSSNFIYFLFILNEILVKCLGRTCYSVDFNRIRILQTIQRPNDGPVEEDWGIKSGGFTINIKSNFVSQGWNSCSYTYNGGPNSLKAENGESCTATRDGTDCFMDIPKIYLTEEQMRAGVLFDSVQAIAGTYDSDSVSFENFQYGPSWSDINNWRAVPDINEQTFPAESYERYGTRFGPERRGQGRWFVKYEKMEDCKFDIADVSNYNQFICDGSQSDIFGLASDHNDRSNYNDNNNEWKWDQNMIGLVVGYIIAAVSICIVLISIKICYRQNGKTVNYKKVAIVDTDEDSAINV